MMSHLWTCAIKQEIFDNYPNSTTDSGTALNSTTDSGTAVNIRTDSGTAVNVATDSGTAVNIRTDSGTARIVEPKLAQASDVNGNCICDLKSETEFLDVTVIDNGCSKTNDDAVQLTDDYIRRSMQPVVSLCKQNTCLFRKNMSSEDTMEKESPPLFSITHPAPTKQYSQKDLEALFLTDDCIIASSSSGHLPKKRGRPFKKKLSVSVDSEDNRRVTISSSQRPKKVGRSRKEPSLSPPKLDRYDQAVVQSLPGASSSKMISRLKFYAAGPKISMASNTYDTSQEDSEPTSGTSGIKKKLKAVSRLKRAISYKESETEMDTEEEFIPLEIIEAPKLKAAKLERPSLDKCPDIVQEKPDPEVYKLRSDPVIRKENVCVMCEKKEGTLYTGEMMPCKGPCAGWFHTLCCDMKKTPKGGFKCEQCTTGIHTCHSCRKSSLKLLSCSIPGCNKFYHEICLKKSDHRVEVIEEDGLVCPLHRCATCMADDRFKKKAFEGTFYMCVRCPTAYHTSDFCIAAGSRHLGGNHIVCSLHFTPAKNNTQHTQINVCWCFSCLKGGALVCCETCPAAFHAECLEITPPKDALYCGDCMDGKQPLYGEVIWAKIGNYRWWPGEICQPQNIPPNIQQLTHRVGEFPVRFFGTRDYSWLHRARVFLFREGDEDCKDSLTGGSKKLKQNFNKACEEVRSVYKLWKEFKEERDSKLLQLGEKTQPPQDEILELPEIKSPLRIRSLDPIKNLYNKSPARERSTSNTSSIENLSPKSSPQALQPAHQKSPVAVKATGAAESASGKHLCVVCGDQAPYRSWGVYGCEGCKQFFKRCNVKDLVKTFVCKNQGKCVMNLQYRTSCSYCRYMKCVSGGMKYQDHTSSPSPQRKNQQKNASTISEPTSKKSPQRTSTSSPQRVFATQNCNILLARKKGKSVAEISPMVPSTGSVSLQASADGQVSPAMEDSGLSTLTLFQIRKLQSRFRGNPNPTMLEVSILAEVLELEIPTIFKWYDEAREEVAESAR